MTSILTFIRRPVLSTVLSLVIVLLGLVAWDRLQVRQYPKINQPIVSIHTELEGAGAEIIESQITKPLENVLTSIQGIDTITSNSQVGVSDITIQFKLNRDIDSATNDVRDRVGRIRDKFPQGVTDSLIKKSEADAKPFLLLAVSSDRQQPDSIYNFLSKNIELDSQIEAVNGVANAEITGGGEYEMRLKVDPLRMASHKITPEDIVSALRKQNVEKPSGQLQTGDREIVLTTKAALVTEQDYDNMIIAERGNYLVKLSDVGKATMKADERGYRNRFNDQPTVVVNVYKQSTSNPLDVSKAIRKVLPEIQTTLPQGMKIEVAHDETVFIEHSIDEVYKTMIEAIVLVILVVFLFLGSLRAALIPIVTIPVSLIGAFFLMYILDFSLNTLTLLSLVMAIGLVVDDAIVVLENIYRYIEEGMTPLKAAAKGAQEIGYPVIAMTMTLAAVYAPIALSEGMTGKVFTEFAITLSAAVIVSGVVALTLSPMMCSRLLRSHVQTGADHKPSLGERFQAGIDRFLTGIENGYEKTLQWTLSWRKTMILIAVIFSGAGWFVVKFLNHELIPQEDMGYFRLKGTGPSDSTLDYSDRYAKQVEGMLDEIPEMAKKLVTIQSPGESWLLPTMIDWSQRKRTTFDILESLKKPLDKITGLRMQQLPPRSNLGGGGRQDSAVQLVVLGSKPFKELAKTTQEITRLVGEVKGVEPGIQSDRLSSGQEFQITVNREKAAALGIDVSMITDALSSLIGKRTVSHFKLDNKRYRIRLETDDKFKRTAEDIGNFFVRGSTVNEGRRQEIMVSLNDILTIQQKQSPLGIPHYKGLRAMNIYANLQKGASLGDVVQLIEEQVRPKVPEGYQLEFMGEIKKYKEEQKNVYFIYILAVLFIFLVLAAQYESYIDPLIILSSIPLSVVGGLVVLKAAGGTMNLYSQIGLVTLIGLISKHGILIVDFANHARLEGVDKFKAVSQAAKLRLRPILMTTLAMVIGALPLALASGAGSESRQQIGWVVVGGMTLGTIFTLYVVPLIYTFFSRQRKVIDI
ncbi:efflux RND transporter permease subunit [Alphaproteobacteria bacterium]|nr:efflux RND transporter permease subunit [Alphaproteobacteria bacterium]